MSATRQAGVRNSGWLQADPCRAGSALAGPFPRWKTESAGPCYYTAPNSSTQCTVGRWCGICTLWQTGPWWSRSSYRCSCSTAQLACGPVCYTYNIP